jgi:hypothetical protein
MDRGSLKDGANREGKAEGQPAPAHPPKFAARLISRVPQLRQGTDYLLGRCQAFSLAIHLLYGVDAGLTQTVLPSVTKIGSIPS